MTTKAQHDFVVRLGTGRKSADAKEKRVRAHTPYGVHAKQVICSAQVSDEKHTGDRLYSLSSMHLPVYEARVTCPAHVCRDPETEDHMFSIRCERSQAQGQHTILFLFANFICLKIVDKKWSTQMKEFASSSLAPHSWHGVAFVSSPVKSTHNGLGDEQAHSVYFPVQKINVK